MVMKPIACAIAACMTLQLPVMAAETSSPSLYEDAQKCAALYVLLEVRHNELEMPSMAKHYQNRGGIWLSFAIDISGKPMDDVFLDQDKYIAKAASKFDFMDDPANEAYVSDTLTRCTNLEQKYRNQLNAAIK